jgi:hypothetical protein
MSRTIHFADKGVRARTAASEPEVLNRLREIVGAESVLVDEERVEPYAGDALKEKFPPEAVCRGRPRRSRRFSGSPTSGGSP